MNKEISVQKFDNKEELRTYLNDLITKLNKIDNFNILIHQINSFNNSINNNPDEDIRIRKMKSIIKNGLHVSQYASIFGTLKLLGSSREDVANKIVDYKFYNKETCACCIFAIPKYVNVGAKTYEYSSFKGCSSENLPEELQQEYKKNGGIPELKHAKCSLIDVNKGFDELPTYYLLGSIYETQNNEYYFINPHIHLSEMPKYEFETFRNNLGKKILETFDSFNTDDLCKIFVKSFLKEEPLRDNSLDYD